MNTPHAKRSPFQKFLRWAPLPLLACVGFLLPAAASAEPYEVSFGAGQVNLGFAFKGKQILPAPQSVVLSSGETQLPDLWQAKDTVSTPGQGTPPNSILSFKPAGCLTEYTYRVVSPEGPVVAPNDGQEGRPTTLNPDYPCDPNPASATLSGEMVDGQITVPANSARFPIMIVPSPIDDTPVPMTLAAEGPLEGQLGEDGSMSLAGPLEVRVLTGLATNPLGTYCSLDLPNRLGGGALEMTSGYSLPPSVGFQGTPFNTPTGPGAITGTWEITSDAESVGGADCERVNGVSKGLGGIWLGAGIPTPPPYPTCADEGKIGTFPNCVLPKAQIGNVGVTGSKTVRRGKRATWKVLVPSTGNVPLEGVSVSASGKGIRASARVGEIAEGASRTVSLSSSAKRAGSIRVTFEVRSTNGGSKKVYRTVRVR